MLHFQPSGVPKTNFGKGISFLAFRERDWQGHGLKRREKVNMASKNFKINFAERSLGKRTPRDSKPRVGTEPRCQSLASDVLPLRRLGTLPGRQRPPHTQIDAPWAAKSLKNALLLYCCCTAAAAAAPMACHCCCSCFNCIVCKCCFSCCFCGCCSYFCAGNPCQRKAQIRIYPLQSRVPCGSDFLLQL